MILIIKHIAIEGPGTIAGYFDQKSIPYRIIELSQGEKLPEMIEGIEGVIVLGGPMNVYEEDKYPFLKAENEFIKKIMEANIPFLGICLGSQLLAKACGAKVKKAPVKEIGWRTVENTPEGIKDVLFNGVDESPVVFQWHEDTFELPQGAQLLTTTEACPHQAFKVGESAYGLQYHIEVDRDIIESWILKYFKVDDCSKSREGMEMINKYQRLKNTFNRQSDRIYQNFHLIVEKARSVRLGA